MSVREVLVAPTDISVSTNSGVLSEMISLSSTFLGLTARDSPCSATSPPPQDFVLIRITNHPGKYATPGGKGDLLVALKAQATEFAATEAPRRVRELERRGFKTKLEPV